ncbi:MAG: enoyl-CoA hydratase/isomerase family protein, partial [Candidatus Eremiobacteraeota bacterium]|nr:enoyl-CoA hydratase/isomerase family protein [Candidatus Eremiobacteraeota bacterium]
MTDQHVTVDREGAIAILTLNRPEKRNPLSLEMMRELDRRLSELGEDRSIGAIVLRAQGPAFSA